MRAEGIAAHPEIAAAIVKVSKQAEAFVNDPANKAEVLRISAEYFKFDMPKGDYIASHTFDLGLQVGAFRTMVRRDAVKATLQYLKRTKQLAALPAVDDLVWDHAPTE
jgi:ABC-type nitrate/sulfonate/bicarbonate transport system substrate-binding protein